ncbi:MAG TPA: RagB/SusD family nutrient uptake outer membrane protein [Gemmatimonadaceae bacterium]|nr:RagB/SusD family nutrient uptake outer membrane protein [Gemmatimonadaceae bacterium]
MAAAVALSLSAGCNTDLDITNPNNPDIERALSSPEDVVQLAEGSVNSWWLTSTHYEPMVFSSVTSDIHTMNYGNFGARFNNLEPRAAYENSSSGGDAMTAQRPWDRNYQALGAANNALLAFANGVALDDADATEAAKHLAMFTQAASLTNLALWFDQAFILDEDTTAAISADPSYQAGLHPYADVTAAAIAKWDALIAATAGKDHAYDESILPLEGGMNSGKLNRIANTMAGMLTAYSARTPAELGAVDWAKVATYTNNGIGTGAAGEPFDFLILSDNDRWYSYFILYGNYAPWMRVDFRLINMMDPTHPDRFTNYVPPKATGDNRINTDFRWFGSEAERAEVGAKARDTIIGDPARGIYMLSPYAHKRWEHHAWHSTTYATGPTPYILATESDLLRAEALVRTNTDLATAAELINNTRVTRGGLAPVSAADGAEALIAAIRYERRVELITTNGLDLMRERSTGWLQQGTPLQLPVPAKELEILGLPIYTTGGSTGK